MRIVEVGVAATHDLRRRVLRSHVEHPEVDFPEDPDPATLHLAATDGDGRVWGIATFFPSPTALAPGRAAWQLRGMAVEPDAQGRGIGRLLLDAGVDGVRRRGGEVLWANARDTALGFYTTAGMRVVGDGFESAGGIPHHVVVLDL